MSRLPDAVATLYHISQSLNQGDEPKSTLSRMLVMLSDHLDMVQGVISVLNPLRNELQIEVMQGRWKAFQSRKVQNAFLKTARRIIDGGRPAEIPLISRDSAFAAVVPEEHLSLIHVPLTKGRRVIGVMSLFGSGKASEALSRDAQEVSIVATMISRQIVMLETFQLEREKQIAADRSRHREDPCRSGYNIVGNSNKMREVFQMISQVSESNATVLVRGESGTGKELVANAVHLSSGRAEHDMIKVNCAAIPENLIESELFGHEKGAFTGAVKQRPGKFELAHNGTLFLDEIGAVDLSVQVKLLRVLQEKEVERVGGHRPRKVDVRIVAATNKNLEKAVEAGTFRGDLYYRLNVFPIYLPPLRERKTDILLLADFFLEKYARENKKNVRRISTPAIDMLMSYHWPGNVRELENAMERAVLLCEDGVIHSYHLPTTLQTGELSGTVPGVSLEDAVARLEKDMIIDALKNAYGNITLASQMLSTTVRKFGYKAKKYGVDYRHYR